MWFLSVIFLFYSSVSYSTDSCSDIFKEIKGSKLHYNLLATEKDKVAKELHPSFINPYKDRALVNQWNQSFHFSPLLEAVLPEGVEFVPYKLYKSDTSSAVKIGEPGDSVMVRASYHYTISGKNYDLKTNVVFNKRALLDNLKNGLQKKWLVGENATAAIFYLHGGGTNSTGAHTISSLVTHFSTYNIDMIAIDLPWHGQGHREFFNIEHEIKSLQNFVHKYIPSNVPVFIWGHSWGAIFAEKIMRMTDLPRTQFNFHPNLKGVIMMSGVVDSAPGKTKSEKYKNFSKRLEKASTDPKLIEERSEIEGDLYTKVIEAGKSNPLGSFYTMDTILNLDQTVPKHKGSKYIPSVMVVGKHDSLVYLGFQDIYEEVYKKLQNVETHYLDKLPYQKENKSGNGVNLYKVGHLLSDYTTEDSGDLINISIVKKFISKQLAKELVKHTQKNNDYTGFINMVQLVSNDLSFREFLKNYIIDTKRKINYGAFLRESNESFKQIEQKLSVYAYSNSRISIFLQKLILIDKTKSVKNLKKELDYILTYNFNPKMDHQLREELVVIKSELDTVESDNISILTKMSQSAKNLLQMDKYKLMNNVKHKTPTFIRKVRFIKNIEKFQDILNVMHIIDLQVRKEITQLMEQHLFSQRVLDSFNNSDFLLESLQKIIDTSPNEKLEKIYRKLVNVTGQITKYTLELTEQTQNRKKIKASYFDYQNTIKQQIKTIREGLENLPYDYSHSLVEDFKNLKKDLELALLAEEKMIKVLDTIHIVTNNQKLSITDISDLLLDNKEIIDDFIKKYTHFSQIKQILDIKGISIMENGEMGVDIQKAVIDFYGRGSVGGVPILGMKNSYTHYTHLTKELAKIEARLYKLNRLNSELEIEYNILIKSLAVIPEVKNFKDPKIVLFFEKVSQILNDIESFPIKRFLDGEHGDNINIDFNKKMTKDDQERVITYLIDNNGLIGHILHEWNQLISVLPPLLPTVYNSK